MDEKINTNTSDQNELPEHFVQEESVVERERQQTFDADAEKFLGYAANMSGSEELQNLLKDPDTKNMILSLIHRREDGTYEFLPERARQILEKEIIEKTDVKGGVEHVKQRQTKAIETFLQTLEDSLKQVKDARSRTGEGADVAKLNDADAVLSKFEKDRGILLKRQHAFVDLANKVLEALEAGKKTVDQLPDDAKELIRDPLFLDGEFPTDLTKAIEFINKKAEITLSEEDRTKLQAAINYAKTKQSEIDSDKDRLIFNAFKTREVYYNKFGGSNPGRLVYSAVRPDYKLDTKLLSDHLKIFGIDVSQDKLDKEFLNTFKLDPAKIEALKNLTKLDETKLTSLIKVLLQKGFAEFENELKTDFPEQKARAEFADNWASKLVDAWDSKGLEDGTGFQKLLVDSGFNNPSGFSIPQLLRDANLPPDVVKTLNDAKLENVSISTLLKLSKLSTLDLTMPPKDLVVKLAEENILIEKVIGRDGKPFYKVNKDIFIEGFTIVFLKVASEQGKIDAEKKAKALWNSLEPNFKHTAGDDFHTVVDSEKFITKLVAEAFVDQAQMKLLNAGSPAEAMVQSLAKANAHNIPFIRERVKMTASQWMKLNESAARTWWEYIKVLPSNLWDSNLDPQILELLKKNDAYSDYIEGVEDVMGKADTTHKILKGDLEQLKKKHESISAIRKPLSHAASPKEKEQQSEYLLIASNYVIETLTKNDAWDTRNIKDRRTSLWLGLNVGIKEASEYLKTGTLNLSEEQKAELTAYLEGNEKKEAVNDIIAPLRNDLGLDVQKHALDILANRFIPEDGLNKVIPVSRARIDEWFNNPADAEKALRAIVYQTGTTEGALDALIVAFNGASQEYTERTVDGKLTNKKTLKPGDARRYVAALKEHLISQLHEEEQARTQALRENRYNTPMDYMRAGKDAIVELFQGDGFDKGMAFGIVMGGLYSVYQMWQNRGKDNIWGKAGKAFFYGGLFLGADKMLKQVRGEGLMDMLKLNYMSEKDRNSAVEQYKRRAEKREGYEELKKSSGAEAMKQLMDPTKRIPIADLMQWRKEVGAPAVNQKEGKKGLYYSTNAPESLKRAVPAIIDKFSVLERRDLPTYADEKERAYKLLFLATESLCIDVAYANKEKGDPVAKGAEIIEKRYVNFTDAYINDIGVAEEIKDIAQKKGGFSSLDVLVYERKTPAMKAAMDNPTITEWIKEKGEAAAKSGIRTGKKWGAKGAVAYEGVKHDLPEYYEKGEEIVLDTTEAVTNWVRVTYAKLAPEVLNDVNATMDFVVNTAKSIGMTVRKVTPGIVEFVYDSTINISSKTFTEIKHIHDKLLTQPELNSVLGSFEEGVMRIFGFDYKELEPDEAKTQFNVELVAFASVLDGGNDPIQDVLRPNATISSFHKPKRTDSIVFVDADKKPISIEKSQAQLETWAKAAAQQIFKKDFDSLLPSHKRFVMEVVQRNMFENLANNEKMKLALAEIQNRLGAADSKVANLEAKYEAQNEGVRILRKEVAEATTAKAKLAAFNARNATLKKQVEQLMFKEKNGTITEEERVLEVQTFSELEDIHDEIVELQPIANTLTAKEESLADAVSDTQKTKEELEKAKKESKTIKEEGVEGVKIQLSSLLPEAHVFKPFSEIDTSALFKDIPKEERKLFGIPFNWLLGDAEYVAFKNTLVTWKTKHLNRDIGYQEVLAQVSKTPEQIKLLADYERYLEAVATNETFKRAMMADPGFAHNEGLSILHLSMYEARHMVQYLEEKERLVSFAQFSNAWKDAESKYRP